MSDERKQFIISVMSRDRVGIVFEVSRAISELAGDIADIRQQVLRGYFTMILYASFPAAVTAEDIRRKLAEVDSQSVTSLEVGVKPVKEPADPVAEAALLANAYVLTASGPDRIGFVATVAQFCAENGLNILDLSTTVADGSYIMILLVDLSRSDHLDELQTRLRRFSQATGLKLVLQHYDIFKATNEIKMI